MMFRRMCDRCADLVVCSRSDDEDLVCVRCGGTLVGPVALPIPDTYRERVEVLSSQLYTGAVANSATAHQA